MKTTMLFLAFALTALLLAACTTTGLGVGQFAGESPPTEDVAFRWRSTDGGITGSMEATLRGQTFEGRFFQIRQETRAETLIPLWMHWDLGWYDWSFRDSPLPPPQPVPQFIIHYTGRVVATLESSRHEHMRCRFQLHKPAIGMSEGGEGECQHPGGQTIRVVFSGP